MDVQTVLISNLYLWILGDLTVHFCTVRKRHFLFSEEKVYLITTVMGLRSSAKGNALPPFVSFFGSSRRTVPWPHLVSLEVLVHQNGLLSKFLLKKEKHFESAFMRMFKWCSLFCLTGVFIARYLKDRWEFIFQAYTLPVVFMHCGRCLFKLGKPLSRVTGFRLALFFSIRDICWRLVGWIALSVVS